MALIKTKITGAKAKLYVCVWEGTEFVDLNEKRKGWNNFVNPPTPLRTNVRANWLINCQLTASWKFQWCHQNHIIIANNESTDSTIGIGWYRVVCFAIVTIITPLLLPPPSMPSLSSLLFLIFDVFNFFDSTSARPHPFQYRIAEY